MFEDLPNGSYDFKYHQYAFTAIPPAIAIDKPFKTYIAYPVSPSIAKYTVRVATTKPYQGYSPPPEAATCDKLFPPGAPPPNYQALVALP